ncbi:cyclic nucleotide-binding domain-containing protein [Argonema galeatum]|uniref:cyclic nucleotide-binding domain-containing protein n=1 Tax=Argonema galeatum TaxID=2942762 RepID=UPI0020123B1C|nr:cyclic nucleotide-binding domain-containing protein [Argonema galeatum]MCL1465336.1 cyclic nucleotide-binding domain-containing protein [Argonema galeatum A003/A1]
MEKVLFILGELSDDDIDWMLQTGKREEVPANTVLIEQGKPIDTLYLLLEGTLTVSIATLDNKEIATLSSGEMVGEMSFIDSRPPSATVKTIENSLLLSIPRRQLATRLQQDNGFCSRFYRALAILLSIRLRGTIGQLGYGKVSPHDGNIDVEQLNPNILDNIAIARTRFDWMLRRLRDN